MSSAMPAAASAPPIAPVTPPTAPLTAPSADSTPIGQAYDPNPRSSSTAAFVQPAARSMSATTNAASLSPGDAGRRSGMSASGSMTARNSAVVGRQDADVTMGV